MEQRRKARLTPKGAAARSLEHAEASLRDLELTTDPNQTEAFVNRLNDFLRAAQTVPEFLGKEPRGAHGRIYCTQHRKRHLFMQSWIESELVQLSRSDHERYTYFINLREISTHDCIVSPDLGGISAEVGGSHPRVTIKYFFRDRPDEDIVGSCKEVVKILKCLGSRAYRLYP